ncbi:MAG: S8 family serine peptidase, partial [Chloroflexota bacterium]
TGDVDQLAPLASYPRSVIYQACEPRLTIRATQEVEMNARRVMQSALVLAVVCAAQRNPPPQRAQIQIRPGLTAVYLSPGLAVAHRVLVKFRPGATAAARDLVRSAAGGEDLIPIGFGWYKLDSSINTTAGLLQLLTAGANIEHVTADAIGTIALPRDISLRPTQPRPRRPFFAAPNDPDYPQQWALSNTGQCVGGVCGTAGADIRAEAAWDYGQGNPSLVVAVIDSGIDYGHPDLSANMWSAPSAYTVSAGGNIYSCPAGSHGFNAVDGFSGCNGQEGDDYGHGTPVAGIIGAVGNNGYDISGVLWRTALLSLVVVDSTGHWTASDVVTAIDVAGQIAGTFGAQADIVAANMSIAGGDGDDDTAIEDAMTQSGLFYAAGVGNECGNTPDWPAAFSLANEVAVSASDQLDQIAYWDNGQQCSNEGGQLAAPGKNDLSTASNNGETLFAGTSDATPHVTGAAALLMADCPLPPQAVANTLEGTADPIPALGRISPSGHRLNMSAAVSSCLTGNQSQATISEHVYTNPSDPDTGTINITVEGVTSSISYYTDTLTTAQLGNEIANRFDGAYTTGTYLGGGLVQITTRAHGPYTVYSLTTQVINECDPPSDCGRPPVVSVYSPFQQQ